MSAGPDRGQFFSSGKPANSHRGKLIPTKRGHGCDICGDTTGACREERNGDLRLCATQGDSLRKGEVVLGSNGSNWRFSHKDKGQGRWCVFYPDRGDSKPTQRHIPFRKQKPSVTRLHVEQRDTAYRLVLERQSLHIEDAEDLFRRGFNADQISTMGVKALKSGLRFKEAPIGLPGFSCGTYIGDTGATFIGAADGNFASSPRQLQTVLGHTEGQDRILLPDGDAIYNPDVLTSYQRLYESKAIQPSPMGVAVAATMGEGQARSTKSWVSVQAQAKKHSDS